ncbi:DUF2271 domain-containing protein [Pseudoteredinibacter isoporae]|uniref:DUF2271 domain-containing protein n=1 Tax=Pseudoteredinibacter isoporae TaxID=570281 RepID=UPI003341F63D
MHKRTLSIALLCWAGSTLAAPYKIDITLPNISAGDYERPYAAVWIANSKNKPQRVVQLWYEDERWLKDLKYFWRRVLRKDEHAADGVTGATKGPGVYSLLWDGLDNKGKDLPSGHYKLCAEVAREHGGHNAKCLTFDWPLGQKSELKLEGELSQLSIEATP